MPFFSMICLEIWIRPSVWDSSSDRFKVQLRKIALRFEKSNGLESHSFSCRSIKKFRTGLRKRGLRTVIWNDSSRPKGALVHAEKSMAAEPKIPKDIVQVPWDYQKARPAIVRRLVDYGFDVWGAPGREKGQILSLSLLNP